ncbi:MAG TPA: helix-turn-helix domain-containing protein [Nitrospirae bacterium]|nr:helix-turn-helix domain-containing protein [Nitrospirota bacterium]
MGKKKHDPSVPFEEGLHKRLKNSRYARAYLRACIEQSDATFLRAIQEVSKAKGITVEQLASRAEINRVSLQKIYAGKTSPAFATVRRLLEGLNIDLSFAPKKRTVNA